MVLGIVGKMETRVIELEERLAGMELMNDTSSVLSEERHAKIEEQFTEAATRAVRMDNLLDIMREELNTTLAWIMTTLDAKSGAGSSE